MSAGTLILILVIIFFFAGTFPRAGAYNANWGYYPFGGVGLIVLILVILLLLGKVRF